MMHPVDWQAAQQIEHLFHASECTVWELLDLEHPAPGDGVVIRDHDDAPVAYADPAP